MNIKYGIFLSVNKDNNSLIYGELKHLTGLKCIELFEGDFISPFSFMQVNPYMQNLIYKDICDNIDGGNVIDAYSGRGVLSSYVAKKANFVYAIEIEKSSCKDAENLIKLNGINNVNIICDDCKNAIQKIDGCIDYVIIDPPRKGASQQVINCIMEKNPKKIFYLSCASNTLARDLTFITKNYHIIKIQPYDMFPNTSNIETLAILEKNE